MSETLARELGRDVGRFARDHHHDPKSIGYRSYIRGHFQVLCTKHPELMLYRNAFYQAAGILDEKKI